MKGTVRHHSRQAIARGQKCCSGILCRKERMVSIHVQGASMLVDDLTDTKPAKGFVYIGKEFEVTRQFVFLGKKWKSCETTDGRGL